MYAGEGKGQLLDAPPGGPSAHGHEAGPESGPALEVIELANGETIWYVLGPPRPRLALISGADTPRLFPGRACSPGRSIVNGLRDDDGESFYGDRASFYSEYSVRDSDNVKLFFKEHERKSSKGSVNSFLARRKSTSQSPSPQPQLQPQPQPQQPKGSARPETKVRRARLIRVRLPLTRPPAPPRRFSSAPLRRSAA